jgi:hypothetical protein
MRDDFGELWLVQRANAFNLIGCQCERVLKKCLDVTVNKASVSTRRRSSPRIFCATISTFLGVNSPIFSTSPRSSLVVVSSMRSSAPPTPSVWSLRETLMLSSSIAISSRPSIPSRSINCVVDEAGDHAGAARERFGGEAEVFGRGSRCLNTSIDA